MKRWTFKGADTLVDLGDLQRYHARYVEVLEARIAALEARMATPAPECMGVPQSDPEVVS